jgi:hypothetical protein
MKNATNKDQPQSIRRGNPHYKTRSGKPWTGADIARLVLMAERQVPAKRIASKLRRSEGAVRAEAARQHVLLAPSDASPTTKQPYGGIRAGAVRAPRNRRAPSLSRARAQAPKTEGAAENFQDTLF